MKIKKLSVILIVVMLSFLLLAGCAVWGNQDSSDALEDEPIIVSTSVAICEILDALEYDNVIGVPETSANLPDRYKNASLIGSPMNPDYEKVKQLSPDFVLSPQTLENSLASDYISAGINAAFLDLSSVEGMYKAIDSLGDLLNRKTQADRLISEYEKYMEDYNAKLSTQTNVLILMAFPDGFYLVATENSYVGNLVKLAGGINVYGSDCIGDENGFVNINPEDIVQKKPDRILVFAHYAEEDAFKYMKSEFKNNSSWQFFDAVNDEKISYLPSEYFGMSASLDWKESLEYLHSDLFGDEE